MVERWELRARSGEQRAEDGNNKNLIVSSDNQIFIYTFASDFQSQNNTSKLIIK